MQVRGKEYKTIEAKDATVKQVKLLILASEAYDEYILSKAEEADAKYEKLKVHWKTLTSSGVIVEADAVVQDIDNLTPETYKEFISSFFPKSSKAPD